MLAKKWFFHTAPVGPSIKTVATIQPATTDTQLMWIHIVRERYFGLFCIHQIARYVQKNLSGLHKPGFRAHTHTDLLNGRYSALPFNLHSWSTIFTKNFRLRNGHLLLVYDIVGHYWTMRITMNDCCLLIGTPVSAISNTNSQIDERQQQRFCIALFGLWQVMCASDKFSELYVWRL